MKRKIAIRRTSGGHLTPDQLDFLLLGWCLDPGVGEPGFWREAGGRRVEWVPFDSEQGIERAWRTHRAEVLAAFTRDKAAGTLPYQDRPWAEGMFG